MSFIYSFTVLKGSMEPFTFSISSLNCSKVIWYTSVILFISCLRCSSIVLVGIFSCGLSDLFNFGFV